MEEEDKENELRTCGESNESPIGKKKMLEYSKGKREEEFLSQESSSSQTIKCSPARQLQKQNVLTSHLSNILDTPNANAEKSCDQGLSKLFGYRRSMKTRKRDDQASESLRQKTETEHGIAAQSIEVIDIDSGYLSDTEMSTDGDTPTPTQSGVLRLTPPSFGANVPRMQGSAAGTKVWWCPLLERKNLLQRLSLPIVNRNRARSLYRYRNMAPVLSGLNCNFGKFPLSIKFLRDLNANKAPPKIAVCSESLRGKISLHTSQRARIL